MARLSPTSARSPKRIKPSSDLPLDHQVLDLGDRLRRIETLGAGLGAIHDRMAAIKPERIFDMIEPVAFRFVALNH